MYKLVNNPNGGEAKTVLLVNGNIHTYIPIVEDNTDYQKYLKWLEEGNTPEPADQGEQA